MTFGRIYKQLLTDINTSESSVSPRGLKVKEILNYHIDIDDVTKEQIIINDVRSTPVKYLKKELCLYLVGNLNINDFAKASKFWSSLDDGTHLVNSNYGQLCLWRTYPNKMVNSAEGGMTQLDWVLNTLLNDPDSRQAVMYLGNPYFQYKGNKDFVCTFTYQFFIRNNKLHMICNRRSNDVVIGITFDIPWEIVLMQSVCKAYNMMSPNKIGLGSYHCNIGSMHAYEKDWQTIKDMLNTNWTYEDIPNIMDATELCPINKIYRQDFHKVFMFLTDVVMTNDMYNNLHADFRKSKFVDWMLQSKIEEKQYVRL